jgi:hypothetical protein
MDSGILGTVVNLATRTFVEGLPIRDSFPNRDCSGSESRTMGITLASERLTCFSFGRIAVTCSLINRHPSIQSVANPSITRKRDLICKRPISTIIVIVPFCRKRRPPAPKMLSVGSPRTRYRSKSSGRILARTKLGPAPVSNIARTWERTAGIRPLRRRLCSYATSEGRYFPFNTLIRCPIWGKRVS